MLNILMTTMLKLELEFPLVLSTRCLTSADKYCQAKTHGERTLIAVCMRATARPLMSLPDHRDGGVEQKTHQDTSGSLLSAANMTNSFFLDILNQILRFSQFLLPHGCSFLGSSAITRGYKTHIDSHFSLMWPCGMHGRLIFAMQPGVGKEGIR